MFWRIKPLKLRSYKYQILILITIIGIKKLDFKWKMSSAIYGNQNILTLMEFCCIGHYNETLMKIFFFYQLCNEEKGNY